MVHFDISFITISQHIISEYIITIHAVQFVYFIGEAKYGDAFTHVYFIRAVGLCLFLLFKSQFYSDSRILSLSLSPSRPFDLLLAFSRNIKFITASNEWL